MDLGEEGGEGPTWTTTVTDLAISRAGEGGHGPRAEARVRRRWLGARGRGHVGGRGRAGDHGGAEGRVGEDAAEQGA